jgi:hypothetical protein
MNKIPVTIGFLIWIEGLLLPLLSLKLIGIEMINLPISIIFYIFLKFTDSILQYTIGTSNINVVISWIVLFLSLLFIIKIIHNINDKIGIKWTICIFLVVGLTCSPIHGSNFLNKLSALNFISF